MSESILPGTNWVTKKFGVIVETRTDQLTGVIPLNDTPGI